MAMTAILNIDVLRAHAVSAINSPGLGNASAPACHRSVRRLRPVLVARWRVRPDGQLACRWETDIAAALRLSPD
jgi:hypothetical protein